MMKAETKAQRRVILQLISLGWARETPPAPHDHIAVRPVVNLLPVQPPEMSDRRMTVEQRTAIMARIRELKIDADSRHKMLMDHYGKDSLADDAPNPLTREEAEHFRVYLDVISGAAVEEGDESDEVVDATAPPAPGSPEDLAAINAIANTPSSMADPEAERRRQAEEDKDTWTVMWRTARAAGLKSVDDIIRFLGHPIKDMRPDAVHAELKSRIAEQQG
jgi:hypothetical protein